MQLKNRIERLEKKISQPEHVVHLLQYDEGENRE
jgi:hypothetical protein